MKSFESPIERIMISEMTNEQLKKNSEKIEYYSDSYLTKIVKYGQKVKKRILKK